MKLLDHMKELCGIEDGLGGVEESDESDGVEELNTVDEFSQEVDVSVVFVGTDEFHYEWGGN